MSISNTFGSNARSSGPRTRGARALLLPVALLATLAGGGAGCDILDDVVDGLQGGGGGGTPPPPPPGKACASTTECRADQQCSVERGVCNRPPGCGPNDACPAVCYGTCEPAQPQGGRCGAVTCGPGLVCCNASCGVCTPPGGVCTQQACEPPPPASACRVNEDCRAFSDYCTGCDCRALGVGDKDPVCRGPGVQCLIDPCANKVAVCDAGRCVLAAAPR